MQVWIGTSGYHFRDWVGPFYPPGTSTRRMLAHYCRHFPLVELNFSFYHPPTASMLSRLAGQTPAGFQFLVKLPRTLSHEEKNDDLPGFRQAIEELHQRGQLLGLLCQLPQATHNRPGHRAWLEHLAAELTGYPMAVEFRHRSWAHAEVTPWLKEHNLDLVSVDAPDVQNLYPSGLVQSGPRIYVRFHSRNADKWYLSEKHRYDYDYSDAALGEWIAALNGRSVETESIQLLFNNCRRGQAPVNAKRMRELILRMGAGMEVAEPFASPEMGEQQRLLFD
jgi:uncharacterized protein YecE (DUF72 family)